MATSLADRYKNNGLPFSDLLNIGGQERYLLNSVNAASHFGVYWKTLFFFKREKKRRAFWADATINLERNAILLIRCWTSFTDIELFISRIARHLSRFALIARCVTMKPRNFPASTANMHFCKFNLMLCHRRQMKTTSKSKRKLPPCLVLISMSSM